MTMQRGKDSRAKARNENLHVLRERFCKPEVAGLFFLSGKAQRAPSQRGAKRCSGQRGLRRARAGGELGAEK
jgi:hypothetical protein